MMIWFGGFDVSMSTYSDGRCFRLRHQLTCVKMDKIPAGIERLLLPKLNEISGEIKALYTRIDSVEKKVSA